MRNTLAFLSLIFIFCILTSCRSTMTPDQLKQSISDRLSRTEGTFAVTFKDLATGTTLLLNADSTFHAASTMKTPVLIEVYKQAAAGRFSLTDSVLVKNEFHSIVDSSVFTLDPEDDSEKNLYGQLGTKRTIYDLVYDMIIMSSNLATNIVIELVGAQQVAHTMREMGANKIQVLRGVEDSKAYQRGLNNTTTANDLLLLFEQIALGKAVDSASSQAMTKILLDQQFNEVIPAKLPKDVKVAHKTGNITGVQHDSGIVFLPDGRKYVLVLLSKGLKDEKAGIAAMADVSEMVYRFVGRRK